MTSRQSQIDPHGIVIRQARVEDQPRVRQLFRDGLHEGQVRMNDTGADIDDLVAGYFADGGASAFWVADHHDDLVGMIGVQNTAQNTGEIRRLRVDTRYRRKGIGTMLMYQAIDFCREQGYLKVVLDVRIERTGAVAMFEKFGFQHGRTREIDNRRTLDFYLDLYRDTQP